MKENLAQTFFRQAFEAGCLPRVELLQQAWDSLRRSWTYDGLCNIMNDTWEVFQGRDR